MRGLALLLLAVSVAPSAAEIGPVTRAAEDEMRRSMEKLKMAEFSGPYFISYMIEDTFRHEFSSTFGGLQESRASHYRHARVDLRVGSPAFDNTHYAGQDYWNYSPATGALPRDDDYDAIRHALWKLTDTAYKNALERYSQKKAYKQSRMIREDIADLSEDPVLTHRETRALDRPKKEQWERRVKKLSAVFKRFPAIQNSKVSFYWTTRTLRHLDSEGRSTLQPANDFELYIAAGTQASDGMRLMHQRRFIRQKPEDFPPFSLLEAEAIRLAQELTDLAAAPAMTEEYIGPVLFENQAAGEFFNQLLAKNISFPREIWTEDERARELFAAGELTGRLGLRVLSPFLNAEDDPGLRVFEGVPLIGHYAFDDEGVPAQRIPLIEAGKLMDIPMSRTPTKERSRSNGHGRGPLWEYPSARISNMVLWTKESRSLRELKDELLRRARDFGLDHAYIARRLHVEDLKNSEDRLSAPALLFRVNADTGQETLVRNARFSDVTLRALRDITAASHRRHVYNFYQLGPTKISQGQTQASIVHPSILVAEMEIKKSKDKPEKLPHIPHPYFKP